MKPNFHKEHEKRDIYLEEGTKEVRTIFQLASIF